MGQGKRDAGFGRRRRRSVAALWVVAFLAGLALLAGAPVASASGQDSIYVRSPKTWSGPVDTLVTLSINEFSGSPYTLSSTTTSPDNGGCANAQPIPGVGPIPTDSAQGGAVTFRWPAALGHGAYYFCADPTNGSGGHAKSHLAYTVLNDAAPAVRFTPSGPVRAGASITFQLTNWVTSDVRTQPYMGLLAQGAPDSQIQSQDAVTPGPADPTASADTSTYTMLISALLPGGMYTLVAQSECSGLGEATCPVTERSAPFAVLAGPTPTVGPPATPTVEPTATPPPLGNQTHVTQGTPNILSGGNPGNLNQSADNTLWYIGGAGIGLAGIAGAVIFFVLRRRRGV